MKTFNPADHSVKVIHRLLLGGVAPRPIALVSTVDAGGKPNLSPFSFFNAFGANPPVVVVSPAYRGTDGTPKHTFLNIQETEEFTVSAVSYPIIEQISLASADYERGVDEFVKAGLAKHPSEIVKAPGVAESHFIMECRLLQNISTGGKPGSGNLLVGEVLLFHVRESVLTEGVPDPNKMDLVGRMGGNWYCRTNQNALFTLAKPSGTGIGFDSLPQHIRLSAIFTGNDLGRFAGSSAIPDTVQILAGWKEDLRVLDPDDPDSGSYRIELQSGNPFAAKQALLSAWKRSQIETEAMSIQLQICARSFIQREDMVPAWECALMSDTTALNQLRT